MVFGEFGERNVNPLVNDDQPNQLQQQLLQPPNQQPIQQPNQQPQVVQQSNQPQVVQQQSNQPQVVQQQPSQQQLDNNNPCDNQVDNSVQVLATLPQPLEVDKKHMFVCGQCFKGFRDQYEFNRHTRTAKCPDAPCKPREKSKNKQHTKCELINDTHMTEEDSMVVIHAKYAEKGFFRYREDTDDFVCAVPKCEAAIRRRKTSRYIQGKEGLQTVFVILGCKSHQHGEDAPLLGYCTVKKKGHKHLIYERSFPNLNDALAAIKSNVYTQFKQKPEEKRSTIRLKCTEVKDCGSELRVLYPNGRDNEVLVKGCVSHNHLPNTEVKIKCSGTHDDHIVVAYQFKGLPEADDFIYCFELEAEFSISSSYYSDDAVYRYYVCGCSGYYEAKTSTKKNIDCSAGFVLRGKMSKDGSSIVTIIGCIRHQNHEEGDIMEDRFKRISRKTKEVICGKLLLGIPAKEVARQMALNIDDNKVDRDVLLEDVRRLARKVTPKTPTMELPEVDAMMAILKNPAIRKFNYNEFIENCEENLSEGEREKYVQTPENRFLLMYMSDRQIQLFNDFPYNLELDGTHKLNR